MRNLTVLTSLICLSVISCQSKNDKKVDEPVVKPSAEVTSQSHNHLIHTMSSAGCEKDSWSPEIYTFYGDAETINKKLENADMDLPNRRLYLVSVESSESALVKLYERSKKEGNVMVQQWEGKDASSFINQASSSILSNKGVNCVGEQTQALFEKLQPKNLGDIPTPVSTQAAFTHDVKKMLGNYLRVTVFLLC